VTVGDSIVDALQAAIDDERPAALATVVDGPGAGAKLLVVDGEVRRSTFDDGDLARVVGRDTQAAAGAGLTSLRHYGLHGEAREDTVAVFIEAFCPPPRLVIFGAVDFTAALVRVAKVLGYRVVVCDARELFATPARFPEADEVVVDWPHRYLEAHGGELGRRDAVCVLTHDAKFDVPAIVGALATDAGYIGAMGSRRTTADREARLRDEGVTPADRARVMAPIGLDLGARTPEETAVAICAEIIAHRTGRAAPHLRDSAGPIHDPGASSADG
jgi:xanthine dehydrogenase accessory factor